MTDSADRSSGEHAAAHPPRVSVILPAYNQGTFVGDAIRSVLAQSHADWELVVVDDGSTDGTARVVREFTDRRIRYLHQPNTGVSAARNAGIAASTGAYVAFLDADDLFEQDKLRVQVAHLDAHHAIGLTYVAHVEIDQDGNPLRLHRPPAMTSLKELLLGYPFSTAAFMVRRSWIERIGGFDCSLAENEDRDFFLRLVLAGCEFAGVERFLAYRRRHRGRVLRNLSKKLGDRRRVLATAFDDPRCPAGVRALRDLAHRNIHLGWAYRAAIQDDMPLSHACFREALRLDPSLLGRNADELLQGLIDAVTTDGDEHEARLRHVFAQLPPELEHLSPHCDWAVAAGYLLRGVHDVIWDRMDQARAHFTRIAALGIAADERLFRLPTYQLAKYEARFGPEATRTVLRTVSPYLKTRRGRATVRWVSGCYFINRAAGHDYNGEYARVPGHVVRAIWSNPRYLTRHGVLRLLFRSIAARWLPAQP